MASMMLTAFLLAARSGDYLILDTETTGLYDAEIVQIAIINQDAEVLLDTLVRPVLSIPEEATAVHGITNDMVIEALPWAFVWADVVYLLAGRNVIVYNAEFDLGMLVSSQAIAGLDAVDWRDGGAWYCAMTAFAEVYGSFDHQRKSYRWQTLSAACAYFGQSEPQLHTALSDCQQTRFLIESMAALSLS